jgi:hypothetical protein
LSIRELVKDMHVRLLAGYAADAVVRAAVVAEAVLKQALGKPLDHKGMLGELIGEAHKAGADLGDLLKDLNWLNRQRIEAVHFTGQVRNELLDDARRAVELVTAAAVRFGLLDAADLAQVRHDAEWAASEPPSTAVLRLDRAEHRTSLDNLLGAPRRLLVVLVHGEVGQGHDHFGEVTWWRLRAVPKGQWRERKIEWPAPSKSTGTRFGFLIEGLAEAVGARFTPPATDDDAAWTAAVAPVLAALDGARERLLIRHVIGWLDDDDATLVARYVRAVWSPLALRKGERVIVALEVRRVEAGGVPLGKQWRTSRTEKRVAAAIAGQLEELEMPRDGHCAALAELGPVTAKDLADWLRAERGRPKSAAETEAAELVATTRGGRFELVIQRLSSLNLDRNRDPHR